MQRHGIGQQLQRTASGSTPHDRITILQICSSCSLPLDRSRQSTLRYPAIVSNRPTIRSDRRDPPLIREPLHRRTACWSASTPFTHLIRGTQNPIAHAAPHTCPIPRFPPLEVCGRRPRCAPRHRHGAGIRKPSQEETFVGGAQTHPCHSHSDRQQLHHRRQLASSFPILSGLWSRPCYLSGECGAGSITVECISSTSPVLLFRNSCQPGSFTISARTAARAARSG